MRSTFSVLPYINRSKVKADGTTAVLCRITVDGKSSTMATGIYCRPEDWNSKTGSIRTVRENNRLLEFRKSVECAYEDSLKKQNVVSAELLKNTLAKKAVIPVKLLQMGEMELERLLVRSKEINSTSTYRNSKYYQKYLTDFLASQGKSDINLAEITEEFGNSYKAFLKRYKNFGPSQMNKCLCWLSKLVYLAVDYEILRANPLEDMEYEKKPAPRHKHISRAELKTILETPMPDPLQELGRRAFLFSIFTGLAYVDIMLLHPHHIGTTSDGRRYIRINRKKTNVEAFIPLHPIAEQILELYNTKDDTKPVFPLPSRDEMWFEIHEMGVAIGREENLSYHIHRHSFDIKSSKVFSFLVGMGVVCGLSIWGNIELWQSKRQYADDALKFRAIRSWGGCSPKEILWLNDVFDIHRDEKSIEWIRGQADGYDKDLKTVSDSLMQESLKVRQMNGNNKKIK